MEKGDVFLLTASVSLIVIGFLLYKWAKASVAAEEYRKRVRSLTQLSTLRTMERERQQPGQLSITQMVLQAGQNAEAKGFHKDKKEFAVKLMLIVSELAESMEADRKHRSAEKVIEGGITQFEYFEKRVLSGESDFRRAFEVYIKDHRETELADALIRIGDLCYEYNIDLEKYVRYVMLYNLDRPAMHGKAY